MFQHSGGAKYIPIIQYGLQDPPQYHFNCVFSPVTYQRQESVLSSACWIMKCYFHSHLSIPVLVLCSFTGRLSLCPPLNFQVISSPMSKLPPSQILRYSFPICACVSLLNPQGTLSILIFFFALFLIFLVLSYYQYDFLADFYWIACNIFKFNSLSFGINIYWLI